MARSSKHFIAQAIETELIVVLAIVLLLGAIIGYSLAAASPTTTQIVPANEITSPFRGEFSGEVD